MTDHEYYTFWHKNLMHFYNISDMRKSQLLALACCRSVSRFLSTSFIKYLDKIELFIDGKIPKEEIAKFYSEVRDHIAVVGYYNNPPLCGVWYFLVYIVYDYNANIYINIANACAHGSGNYANRAEQEIQMELVKDMESRGKLSFSKDISNLAKGIYDNFSEKDSMLVLSDALEEEGHPEHYINHLKSGNHHKGCWLIDQILGL